MAILDTFVSIFEADTNDLRRGHDEARRSTDEIVDSMRRAETQADTTGASMAQMLTRAVGAIGALALANRGLRNAMARASDIYQMSQTADSIGVAVEQMDSFTRSVTDNGGTAQGVLTTLTNTYRSMGRAIHDTNSQQAQAFASLGVGLRDAQGEMRNTMDVVLDIADAMSGLEGGAAEALAQRLGITDRRTIEVMLRGREELERMMRAHEDYGVVTQESAERSAAFSDAMSYLSGGIDRASLRIADALMPTITRVLEVLGRLVRWMHDNSDFVVGFFSVIAGVITAAFLPAIISAATGLFALISPFLLVGAAVGLLAAGIALLYDDIRNFMRGNDSFIGQIAKEYPALGRIIENLGEIFRSVFSAIGSALDWLSSEFGLSFSSIGDVIRSFYRLLFGSLDAVAEWAYGFEDHFQRAANGVVAIFKWLWAQVQRLLRPIMGAVNLVKDGLTSVTGTVRGWFGGGDVDADISAAGATMSGMSSDPMNAVTSSVINNTGRGASQNLSVGEITINTQATDAAGVARDVRSELSEQLKGLESEYATGVAR